MGASLLLLFVLAGIIQGTISGDVGGMLRRIALELPVSIVAMIGLVTGPMRYLSARERSAGFIDALARRGIKVPPSRIVEGGYTFESGVAAAERLLAGKPRPTCRRRRRSPRRMPWNSSSRLRAAYGDWRVSASKSVTASE